MNKAAAVNAAALLFFAAEGPAAQFGFAASGLWGEKLSGGQMKIIAQTQQAFHAQAGREAPLLQLAQGGGADTHNAGKIPLGHVVLQPQGADPLTKDFCIRFHIITPVPF